MKHRWLLLLILAGSAFAEDFKPNLGPDLERIEVTCGEVTLLLRQASQWTPGRIDYRGTPMSTERSAYGTLFSFPGTGFIGTAHLENEPEKLERVAFFIDDAPLDELQPAISGKSFRFQRESRVRGIRLSSVIELCDNRLYETATVRTDDATPQDQIYHFMHAWVPTVSRFLAGYDEKPDEPISGVLTDGEETIRKFYIRKPVDWVAVFDKASGQFAVSRILEAPDGADNISMIWNVPPAYRKYYLKCFQNDTIPARFNGTWKMVTAFGESKLAEWEIEAAELADKIK